MKKLETGAMPPREVVSGVRPEARPVADLDEAEPTELENRRSDLERRRAIAERIGIAAEHRPARPRSST